MLISRTHISGHQPDFIIDNKRRWTYVLLHGDDELESGVYVLKNLENPTRYYTGLTSDVIKRCALHSAGNCVHTAD